MVSRYRRAILLLLLVTVGFSIAVLEDQPQTSANTVVTVVGRAVYEDADANTFGIYKAKVLICDDDGIFGRQCVETTTNSSGDYSGELNDSFEDDDRVEVYVEIIADSSGVVATPADLINPFAYCYRTSTRVLDGGSTTDFGEQAPLSNNSCGRFSGPHTDPRENAAFSVYSQLRRGWDFMSDITQSTNGALVPKVDAQLIAADAGGDNVSYYSGNVITLQPNSWEVGSTNGLVTIYHEYGHHLLKHFAESPPPDYVNGNCDDFDPFLIFEIPDPGHCRWQSEKGVVAWTEGFPTFIAAVMAKEALGTDKVQNSFYKPVIDGTEYYYQGTEFPIMEVVDTQTGVLYTLGDTQGIIEGHPDTDFEHIEGWTTSALWDLYDTEVDDHDKDDVRDTVSISFEMIWDVLTNYDPAPGDDDHNHPLTAAEFHEGLVESYSDSVSAARLAGPFLENHLDVPATELTVSASGTYQDWNSNDRFGRGDVISAHFEICRPADSDVSWGGEGQVGVILLHPTSGARLFTPPPMTMPDVAPGGCASGIYEFTVPEDMELFGPRYIGGSMSDNHAVFDAVVCADPQRLISELDEMNNCRDPHTLRLQNKPPTLISNAPIGGYVVDEGSDLVIDFTGSADPDPIPGQGLEYKVASSGTDFNTGIGFESDSIFTFTPADTAELADGTDPGTTHTLQLRIRDDGDPQFSSEAIALTSVTVNNVAPNTVITNIPTTGRFLVFEGTTIAVEGEFVDPGDDEWTVTAYFDGDADWTDGVITDAEFNTSIVPNRYQGHWQVEKTFTNQSSGKGVDFHVCVTDDDGGVGCTPIGQALVVVYNVVPVVVLPDGLEANEVGEVILEGSFTDPGEDPWTATVEIDGSVPTPFSLNADKSFSVPLAFTEVGFHPVTICVTDDRATGCETVEVEVINLPPEFDLAPNILLDEGDSLVINATFTDPGQDVWTGTVSFDGGTPEPLVLNGFDFSIENDYPQDGTYGIEVCISDGFSSTCRNTVVTVENVAPSFDIGGPITINESESVFISESFIDPGADSWTATVSFNGVSVQPMALEGFGFTVDHHYPEDGNYTIEVCISDDDSITCDILVIDVLNVAPDVAIGSVPDAFVILVTEQVMASFSDPGVHDTHTATVDWGDGVVESLSIEIGAPPTGVVIANHAYQAVGTFTIEICIADDDGGVGCASISRDVLDPAEALSEAISDLHDASASDPTVLNVLKDLEGSNNKSSNGALAKIESGNYVAAITQLEKAVDAFADSDGDYRDVQFLIVQIGESVARDLLAQVEALGLTDLSDLAEIDAMRESIDRGRTALEEGSFTQAIQELKSAVQIGVRLL